MKALLLYPTHANCREVVELCLAAGIGAVAYPLRTTRDTEHQPVNCWNADADRAEQMGFSVVTTVCPACEEQKACHERGYRAQLAMAKDAVVALATHQRTAFTGFEDLAAGRDYLALHEWAIDVLRPTCSVGEGDLQSAHQVVQRLLSDPKWLDWFGDDERRDADGNVVSDPEQQVRRDRLYEATRLLSDMLDDMARALSAAEVTTPWRPPQTVKLPQSFERLMFRASRQLGLRFQGDPWRFILRALSGDLYAAVVLVPHRKGAGGQRSATVVKRMLGVSHNPPPSGRVVWFNDATLNVDRLQSVLKIPVHDATPDGRVALQKKALQVPRDVTRKASPRKFMELLRGVLVSRRSYQRVGLITHRTLVRVVTQLEPEFRERIVRSTYFGSGEDRSSNAWHEECDLIVVAGTPRIPPEALAAYLVQVGEVDVACRIPQWGRVVWYAEDESGQDVRVEARGYYDIAWRSAHRDLVRSALVQAIGRGRGILATGCDVLVVSTEECGVTISDDPVPLVSDQAVQVWQALRELTARNPKRYLLGNHAVNTASVAEATGLAKRTVRQHLAELQVHGLVQRVGPRSGWLPGSAAAGPPSATPDGLVPAPSQASSPTTHQLPDGGRE